MGGWDAGNDQNNTNNKEGRGSLGAGGVVIPLGTVGTS